MSSPEKTNKGRRQQRRQQRQLLTYNTPSSKGYSWCFTTYSALNKKTTLFLLQPLRYLNNLDYPTETMCRFLRKTVCFQKNFLCCLKFCLGCCLAFFYCLEKSKLLLLIRLAYKKRVNPNFNRGYFLAKETVRLNLELHM